MWCQVDPGLSEGRGVNAPSPSPWVQVILTSRAPVIWPSWRPPHTLNTPSRVTEAHVVAPMDDVLDYLSHVSMKSAKDDLVKMTCDYYHERDITKTSITTFTVPPKQPGPRTRRTRSRVKADTVSTILDLLQNTPPDAVLPVMYRHISNTAEYSMSTKVKRDLTEAFHRVSCDLTNEIQMLVTILMGPGEDNT